ncbi:hypothetical protein [Aestuariispira ectoiniformans]|uniref:hypothetical protein n=1 Tax=Aestuariispira ectoiniformans TaxID=2775080 RepID=UPI00223C06BF|nr:hypothetical protein [Aestuariispira ectoiniformans]
MGLYKPRYFRTHDMIDCSGIRLKPYTIALEDRRDINLEPIFDYANYALSGSQIPWLQNHGLGYLVYHTGEDGNWLLLRTWTQGDIVAGLISADHGCGFKTLEVPCIECVWEAVISQHERDAWVRHMMSGQTDADGYLADKLADGLY